MECIIAIFAVWFLGFIAIIHTDRMLNDEEKEDAYNSGYEEGRQAEKESVEKIIRDFAECNDDCKTNFYYGQGCNACFWNTIIKKIKGDPE